MLPVIALVGRPNVGKSTLFNRLTKTRDALVADYAGLTRDRQYGYGKVGPSPYLVIDTGGLAGVTDGVEALMERQAMQAIEESDAVVFMVDARDGLMPTDHDIAGLIRRHEVPVFLAVNKGEGLDQDTIAADFFALGLGDPLVISSAHGDRVSALIEHVLEACPVSEPGPEDGPENGTVVTVAGRPNVGKSTLINRLIGEDRLVAFDRPGTTRDSVRVPFSRDGKDYVLVDTAGVRRRSRVSETIEKFSIIKTLQAIEQSNVVIAVLDAREGVTDQDVSLFGLIIERGRALVIAVNKWDGLDSEARKKLRDGLEMKLAFSDFAPTHFISALHGTAVGKLLPEVDKVHRAACRELGTSELTQALEGAVTAHPPPLSRGRRPRLRYAHQGGRNPPIIVIHGNQTERLAPSYRRYLINYFRKAFKLRGTPVRLQLKTGKNPFEGRRNKLTPRQQARRKRLMKHVKGKK
ncbi:MAG: ribosome biogenesis GTPase Der [Pseudomonadota bacterium]